jgi:hypothetical protein
MTREPSQIQPYTTQSNVSRDGISLVDLAAEGKRALIRSRVGSD